MSKTWKRVRSVMLLVALCSLTIGLTAAEDSSIQTLPGTGWTTGIQIQNVGTASAQIDLTGYARTSGLAAATQSVNVAVGASANFTTYPAAATSFEGAGVVSSDQPIVAIVNVNNGPIGGFAAGQYQGTSGDSVATTLRFPLAKNNLTGKCTTFYVQNASSSPANITATFSNNPPSVATFNNVPANSSVLIDPAAATPALPSTAPFALTVTASQPVAGTVLENFCTSADTLQATRGFTPNDTDTVVFAPIFKQVFNGRTNGIQVQNVHTGAVDITVEFTCSTGCTGSFTHKAVNVASGSSATFFNNAVLGGTSFTKTGNLPTGALTSAKVTATVTGGGAATPVVAINNESFVTPLPAGVLRNTQTTYSALPASAASAKVGIPLVKEEFANKTTGIQIQNTSNAATTAKVIFSMTAPASATCLGTYTLSNINIAPNSSVTLFRTNTGSIPAGATWDANGAIKKGCFGGAIVEVTTTGGKVVAVVQEPDINANTALRQDTKNYEGFPIQ